MNARSPLASPPPARPTAEQIELLAQVIRTVTRRRRMPSDDAEDFGQSVHLKLLERDYDVFDRHAGPGTLTTFLTVVVGRLLIDWQRERHGKWRPSASAVRLGAQAIDLDRLINRDGLPVQEAIQMLSPSCAGHSSSELRELAARVPLRPRRRMVPADVLDTTPDPVSEDPLLQVERLRDVRRRANAVRRALYLLAADDRRLLAARFGHHGRLSTLARDTGADVKVLYRRCERVLKQLRAAAIASVAH